MSGFIEIRVRRFYTHDEHEADITPGATIVTDSEKAASMIGEDILKLVSGLDKMLADMPQMKGARLMTLDEVKEYRADEADDES